MAAVADPRYALGHKPRPAAPKDHRLFATANIMLVLSRMREESIFVSDADGGCVLTVLHVRGGEVWLLVSHSCVAEPGVLKAWTTTLARGASFKVDTTAEVTLLDVHEEKARIGISAPKSARVHRLEVWEAIQRENRRGSGGDPEDGSSGSPVPRPGGPKPPPLDVRLNEPPPPDGCGE
jgi:carbon storage regulator